MSLIQAHRAVLRQNIARTRVVAPARGAHGEYRVRRVRFLNPMPHTIHASNDTDSFYA